MKIPNHKISVQTFASFLCAVTTSQMWFSKKRVKKEYGTCELANKHHTQLTSFKFRDSHNPFKIDNLIKQFTGLSESIVLMIAVLLRRI